MYIGIRERELPAEPAAPARTGFDLGDLRHYNTNYV